MYRNDSNYKTNACSKALWRRYHEGIIPVIPDIKLFSAREGNLMRGRNPVDYALLMESCGAPVISVVTEEEHFGGSLKLLEKISEKISVPVLRKDFIKTKQQVKDSKQAGADAVLLIVSMLDRRLLAELVEFTLANGIEPLVEVHNEEEFNMLEGLDLSFIGINNRNILKYEVDNGDVATTELLGRYKRKDAFLLSESSITDKADVMRAISAGANGVLVGTAILQAEDSVCKYKQLAYSYGSKTESIEELSSFNLLNKISCRFKRSVNDYK
ncbi:MAG: indole-3-glycerol-phosphate synthase [Clostridiales bacterium]|jgi:indole-3-glycerol phosphate synthase|nr:indole-3-glycerol-phosphate synthase [Clostridiales bacterium]